MLHNETPPLRVRSPSHRSAEFELYLAQQTPERREQIRAAEQEYSRTLNHRFAVLEQTFYESMRGHEDVPPGSRARGSDLAYLLRRDDGGDWSWKPARDKVLGTGMSFRTFQGVPPSAAELYGRRSYSPA